MLNKKVVVGVSVLAVGVFLALNHIGTFELCGGKVYGSCMDSLHSFFGIFLPIVPFFVFALITYFMRDEVYKTWVRVAFWMLGISMILIAITPGAQTGGFGPQISFGKPDVAFLACLLFVLVSIVLIAWKYFLLRK